MAEKMMRLSQVARKFNIGRNTIVDFLAEKGYEVDSSPNAKIPGNQVELLAKEFASSAQDKEEALNRNIGNRQEDQVIDTTGSNGHNTEQADEEELFIKGLSSNKKVTEKVPAPAVAKEEFAPAQKETTDDTDGPRLPGIKVLGKVDLDSLKKGKPAPKKEAAPAPQKPQEVKAPQPETKPEPAPVAKATPPAKPTPPPAPTEPAKPAPVAAKTENKAPEKAPEKKEETINAKADTLKGLTVLGKIELPEERKPKPVASSDERKKKRKRRRRIKSDEGSPVSNRPNTAAPSRGGDKKGGKKSGQEEGRYF